MGIDQDARDATRYVPGSCQGGLGLPDRDYYLSPTTPSSADARAKYVAYLAQLLELSRAPADAGRVGARAVLALETDARPRQWSPRRHRDPVKAYNPVALAALPTLAPALDWPALARRHRPRRQDAAT